MQNPEFKSPVPHKNNNFVREALGLIPSTEKVKK
jgi:hypothetical protein